MKKALGIIILTAFSVGLVAETACEIHSLATGQAVTASTAIELIVCWGVVLAVFIASIVSGFRGSARWFGIGVAVSRSDDDDVSDDDSDNENKEESTTPDFGYDGVNDGCPLDGSAEEPAADAPESEH